MTPGTCSASQGRVWPIVYLRVLGRGPPDIRPGNLLSWRDRGRPAHARVFTASLASTHSMQVAPQPVLTTEPVSRHALESPRGNVVPRRRTTALDEFHAATVTAASPGLAQCRPHGRGSMKTCCVNVWRRVGRGTPRPGPAEGALDGYSRHECALRPPSQGQASPRCSQPMALPGEGANAEDKTQDTSDSGSG